MAPHCGVVGPSEVVTPPRSRLSPSLGVGRGGDHRLEVEVESEPGSWARRRPSSEVEVESEPGGRARRRPLSEVEVESEPRGRARRRPSSEVEVESEPWGRARRRFLWRPRLDLAAVSLTLASGTAVGAAQAALFSCQVNQWRGEVTAVTSTLSTGEHA
jgi:hypothetical protein